jgi:hypothetical protein
MAKKSIKKMTAQEYAVQFEILKFKRGKEPMDGGLLLMIRKIREKDFF